MDGKAGGRAGPVEQAEDHQAYGSDGGPPVLQKNRREGGHFFHLYQAASLQVGHENDGQDDLIGRKSQDKRGQDHAVKPHETAERVQKAGKRA